MQSNLPKPASKENMTNNLQNDVAFLIVGCFILYAISQILEFIFKPLKMLSEDQVTEKFEQMINNKRAARLSRTFDDPNDPMNQFQMRFIEKKPKYKKDKENNVLYYAWFQEWQNGNVIDSELRWAPDILNEEDNLRPNFIQYMKIQYFLHKKSGFIKRALFLNTLYKYYPELSSSMRGLAKDLANYEDENTEIETEKLLRNEIQKFGLPEELAEYLANRDTSTLREEAKLLKRYIEEGHPSEACICVLENRFNKEAFESIELILKAGLPVRVGTAYVKGEITDNETAELLLSMAQVQLTYEEDTYTTPPGSNKTIYDDILDSTLEEYKRNKVIHKLNQKVSK